MTSLTMERVQKNLFSETYSDAGDERRVTDEEFVEVANFFRVGNALSPDGIEPSLKTSLFKGLEW